MDRAFAAVYAELRRLAHRQLGRNPDHGTLSTTALVHEAYLRLVDSRGAAVAGREHFFAANERFHLRLLELADNRWRLQMVSDLRKVMKLNRHHSLFKAGRIEESLAEHRAVMAALRAHDGALAMRRMREHFASGLEAAT